MRALRILAITLVLVVVALAGFFGARNVPRDDGPPGRTTTFVTTRGFVIETCVRVDQSNRQTTKCTAPADWLPRTVPTTSPAPAPDPVEVAAYPVPGCKSPSCATVTFYPPG